MAKAYSVSVGMEVILSDVKDVAGARESAFPLRRDSKWEDELLRVYGELRKVAELLTGRYNSTIERKNKQQGQPYDLAKMVSNLRMGGPKEVLLALYWSPKNWVITLSRALTDQFLPLLPFEFRSPMISYAEPHRLRREIKEVLDFLHAQATVEITTKCGLHVMVNLSEGQWTLNQLRAWKRSVHYFENIFPLLFPEHRRDRAISGLPMIYEHGVLEAPHPGRSTDWEWYYYVVNDDGELEPQEVKGVDSFLTRESVWSDDSLVLGNSPPIKCVLEFRTAPGIEKDEESEVAVDLAVNFVHASLRQGSADQLRAYPQSTVGLSKFLESSNFPGRTSHMEKLFNLAPTTRPGPSS